MLSYVLLRLNIKPEVQKEHMDWTVKNIKKNLSRYPKETLGQFLDIQDGPMHPVLAALDDEAMPDLCSHRYAEDSVPMLQMPTHLLLECQRANWKAHKEQCTDIANSRARVEKLKQEGSPAAQKEADWVEWRNLSHYANTYGLQHALGVHRDPLRGHNHIVVRQVKYTPEESDLRYRFMITHAGVFKLDDCWDAVDEVMSGRAGEGKEMVRDILNDIDSTSGSSERDIVPLLDLTFGDVAITFDSLRHHPYDPDWRKSINKKGVPPPDAILKFKNAVDVEHKFD
ncbi:uncharacterized protein PHACADRAFT_200199 [Phanerochaete carnosa HHB-10118-sp]|uniref:Uncharacterized protein n=1 Tax=Phanerochaete carnosa (strain HHB-10118-sp) TaxID=650164 RepID=K5WM80_PHACS|nr:uncharacterized protein PHACADRAFT_200199 [Phanerochaete carnosa HHB-10118-sp]EKM51382.1 hypothetical protein PHACADRAFT_200199 [Phanerochaete carnosa HHB-10118-sp]